MLNVQGYKIDLWNYPIIEYKSYLPYSPDFRFPIPIGGFPIEIEIKLSKLISYSLAIFYNIKIAMLYCNKLAYLGFYFDRKSTLFVQCREMHFKAKIYFEKL